MKQLRLGRAAALGLAMCAAGAVTTQARDASAFCGFYVAGSSEQLVNKATRVALMRWGERTVLSMSNDYDGPPESFAMVVPVPIVLQKENVKTLPMDVFSHLDQLTSPRLVEYWERDPCYQPPPSNYDTMSMVPSAAASGAGPGQNVFGATVRIEAQFKVGEYDVLVLSASESSGLETWLRQNRYNIPRGAAEALAPYVREQWKFFVAKVDIQKVERKPEGGVRLSPLRFHYDSRDFRLPVRLGLLNSPAKQDLLVYVLHPKSRFEVANYPNVFVPTNLDVADSVKPHFGEFYSALFDATMDANPRSVVTEYAWSVGGCDPCPGPPMADGETAVLGGDVLYVNNPQPQDYHGRAYDYVVTRLHTRYDRATLTEDLVFKEADAIAGGREVANANGEIEQGAIPQPGGYNNFQARYAIRHPWAGPIKCANPKRGVWDGPPGGYQEPAVASNVQDTSGSAVNLNASVLSQAPGLNLGPANASAHVAGWTPPAKRGCACVTAGAPTGSDPSWTALAGVGAVAWGLGRLRRRKST